MRNNNSVFKIAFTLIKIFQQGTQGEINKIMKYI